jgi:hypothetical protein
MANHMSHAWGRIGHPVENPGLMTGLAGLGYFLLRAANPSLPSVLLPGADLPSSVEKSTHLESV